MIYAIQCGAGGPIKLGLTANSPRRRFNQLQSSHHERLSLLASAEGDAAMERLLHEHLAAHRIRGEWYRATVPVLEMVRLMREGGEKPLQAIALKIVESYAAKAQQPAYQA